MTICGMVDQSMGQRQREKTNSKKNCVSAQKIAKITRDKMCLSGQVTRPACKTSQRYSGISPLVQPGIQALNFQLFFFIPKQMQTNKKVRMEPGSQFFKSFGFSILVKVNNRCQESLNFCKIVVEILFSQCKKTPKTKIAQI